MTESAPDTQQAFSEGAVSQEARGPRCGHQSKLRVRDDALEGTEAGGWAQLQRVRPGQLRHCMISHLLIVQQTGLLHDLPTGQM